MVVLLSSQRRPAPPRDAFRAALTGVCRDLAEDIVRNAEGVHQVWSRSGARPRHRARRREGHRQLTALPVRRERQESQRRRLLCAIGKHVGAAGLSLDMTRILLRMGGEPLLGAACSIPAARNASSVT